MTFVFHACGSQLLNFVMPGSKRVLTDSFIARRMHDIDIPAAELHFEITGGERIPNGYTLLDLVFVAATSAYRNDHFADTYKILRITLDLRPILVPLGPSGQNLL